MGCARLVAVMVVAVSCRYDFDPRGDGGATLIDYRTAVLADAPVGYWRLGGLAGTASDVIGANPGTLTSGCKRGDTGALAGDPDLAVHFDGLTCKIVLADQPVLQFPNHAAYSLEVWVMNVSAAGYYHYITRETRSSSDPIDGYALFNDDAPAGVMLERVVGGSVVRTSPVTIPTNRFVHLVGTYDGTTLRVFIDGVLASTQPDARSMTTFADIPLLGAHSTSAFVDGVLDEVAIYDHELTPERIAFHHLVGTAGPQPR